MKHADRLDYLAECAAGWEDDVTLLGNQRAADTRDSAKAGAAALREVERLRAEVADAGTASQLCGHTPMRNTGCVYCVNRKLELAQVELAALRERMGDALGVVRMATSLSEREYPYLINAAKRILATPAAATCHHSTTDPSCVECCMRYTRAAFSTSAPTALDGAE